MKELEMIKKSIKSKNKKYNKSIKVKSKKMYKIRTIYLHNV